MSEAANYPPVYGLPCSLGAEPLVCSRHEATCIADRGSHPPALREEQALSPLCPRTPGDSGPKLREQTGLHHPRREGETVFL